MEATDLYWRSEDGLRLHAVDYPAAGGDARLPVICIHGLTRNARDFDALAPLLASGGRRVLAIDVRGRGRSDYDPRAGYVLPTYAADVVALARQLGLARAVFVGTSMGGLITMELAEAAPGLVAAAVVNDVGPELDPAGLARIAAYVGKAPAGEDWWSVADYLKELNGAALPHYRSADWRRMARRTYRALPDGRVVADYDPDIAKPFAGAPLQIDPWQRWDALANGRPILLLRGALSDLLSAAVAGRMIADRSDATVGVVPEVGHAPMLDEPAAADAIQAFLAKVD